MDILCPVCKKPLSKIQNTFKCVNGHSFDIAREGYLNLNRKKSDHTGDNPDMIRARKAFLDKGYYAFLKDAVNSLLKEEDELVDLACGEGYYTKDFICRNKIGIDLSKQGLKIASKADKNTTYLLNSIFRNPLGDHSADKIITIFAPIAAKEIVRILKDDGRFILVRPDKDHLFELKQVLYENPYLNESGDIAIQGLVLEKQLAVSNTAVLNREEVKDLFMMTPYVNTTSKADKEKLEQITALPIRFSFLIDVYKKG